ncbi:unnamed protein product [Didymodactylos carnosus]|uniref:MACPF domain-containing protein n=1 Tax=Didymodactylos carnosus TaxID=1234261 RepID=A0A815E6W8_9BILA|nr:unnamed protein product [Didymodactylos carnosus]CAF1306279.1 unnamed protein product [Didymodactylos carnosus]CAF3784490.1 unnamed protein product [Didymodactylos carnosus]CAF4139842.1 unnamed protein product [Didymodactylos carnosus]
MLQLLSIIFLLTSVQFTKGTSDTYLIYEKVGQYLRNYEMKTKQAIDHNSIYGLENSNKIGMGYNPVYGSPVCYTGVCQMEGFAQPIFKLQYQSSAPGSCTNKLVPNFVAADCLPSFVTSASTEVINTLKQLSESISNKIEVSIGAKYGQFSFGYTNSRETNYMVDNIVQNNLTLMYTTAQVSHIKLSMFEPLSDIFNHVIDNLPCCDSNDYDTEKYIRDYIFSYFGYTYVSTLLLGGIVQQNIFMNHDSYKRLESRNISTKNAAKVEFNILSSGVSVENSQAKTEHQEFMKEVKNSYGTILGGDPSIQDINEWSKTVPSNPVIIKFGIREIFDLLNKRRFPNDPQIQNKSKLIEEVLTKYIAQPLFCYNNCVDKSHGTCESSGYFQFGICKCNQNWTGLGRKTWAGADFTVCYKATTTKNSSSIVGGLCGLNNSGGKQSASIPCNNSIAGTCPNYIQSGYSLARSSLTVNGVLKYPTGFCYKSNSAYPDLPGTLCGIQWAQSVDGPACGGYNPGLSQCPPGYSVQLWVLEYGTRFHLCAKR